MGGQASAGEDGEGGYEGQRPLAADTRSRWRTERAWVLHWLRRLVACQHDGNSPVEDIQKVPLAATSRKALTIKALGLLSAPWGTHFERFLGAQRKHDGRSCAQWDNTSLNC